MNSMMQFMLKVQECTKKMVAIRPSLKKKMVGFPLESEEEFVTQFKIPRDQVLSISCPPDTMRFEVWIKGSEADPVSCGDLTAVLTVLDDLIAANFEIAPSD